jgi:hypothetical protein
VQAVKANIADNEEDAVEGLRKKVLQTLREFALNYLISRSFGRDSAVIQPFKSYATHSAFLTLIEAESFRKMKCSMRFIRLEFS